MSYRRSLKYFVLFSIADLLPPLHVGGAPLVVDVEEGLTRALGDGVHLLVIELVTHDPVRLGVQS